MAKKRTRKQKERAGLRKTAESRPRHLPAGRQGFAVSFSAMEGSKRVVTGSAKTDLNLKFFRSDLTKVAVLTMLALALEIALWRYLPR